MEKLAAFIVDKRSLFFLLVVLGIVFSCFSQSWVEVENDLTAFLPDDSETSRGLAVMEEQFTTYGTAQVMIANIDPVEAQAVADLLGDLKGVQSVAYDETDQHYNNISALYDVTFDYDEDDDACLDALELVKTELAGYDLYVSTELGNALSETIDAEVSVIMVVVAIIVVAVLLFVCDTVAEVPVLLLTFLTAMILNSGTNFLLGKISFVSNSVTSILQLALSLDYAIIFSNHFKEEHETLPLREAAIAGVGENLGRGTVTSIILVLFVLPQILLIGGTIVDRPPSRSPAPSAAGRAGAASGWKAWSMAGSREPSAAPSTPSWTAPWT